MKYDPVYRDGCSNHYHDTVAAYHSGCRCPAGIRAHSKYMRLWRDGHLPDTRIKPSKVSRRKLRALAASGWSMEMLAKKLGCTDRNMRHFANPSRDNLTMQQSTVEIIDELYAELKDNPGPSKRSIRLNRARGWVPVYAWADIDDPDAEPVPGEIVTVDYEQIDMNEIDYLLGLGFKIDEIENQMGISLPDLTEACEVAGRNDLLSELEGDAA